MGVKEQLVSQCYHFSNFIYSEIKIIASYISIGAKKGYSFTFLKLQSYKLFFCGMWQNIYKYYLRFSK
jgi:hypothetical protein